MLSPGPSGRGVLPFAGWEAGSSLSGLWAWLLWRCSSLRTDPEAQLPARGLARRVSPAPPHQTASEGGGFRMRAGVAGTVAPSLQLTSSQLTLDISASNKLSLGPRPWKR